MVVWTVICPCNSLLSCSTSITSSCRRWSSKFLMCFAASSNNHIHASIDMFDTKFSTWWFSFFGVCISSFSTQVNPHSALITSMGTAANVWSNPVYNTIVGYMRFLTAQCRDWVKNVVNLFIFHSKAPIWSSKRGMANTLTQVRLVVLNLFLGCCYCFSMGCFEAMWGHFKIELCFIVLYRITKEERWMWPSTLGVDILTHSLHCSPPFMYATFWR